MMNIRHHRLFCLMTALVISLLPAAVQAEAAVSAGGMQYTLADSGFLPGLQAIAPMAGNQFLIANLVLKAEAGAQEMTDPDQWLLAVDEGGRVYTPLLFHGESTFTASLAPGEKALRVLFEIPKAAGGYQLAVLSGPGGEAAGRIDLGRSVGSAMPADGEPLASVTTDGYTAVIHSVTQSKTAFLDEAPEGMKYVWIDATFTGSGTQAPVSQLAAQWAVRSGNQENAGVIPARAVNMLALANTRFNDKLPAVRGKLCFLVPEGLTELIGLAAGQVQLAPLPITGELSQSGMAQLSADGAYYQAGWKVTIHSMRYADKGKLKDPPAGNRYVIVNLTLENQSTQNMTVSSELGFAMTDAQGNELSQAWFADLTETLDAALLPSESVSGEVAFLLPDRAKAGMLRVHLNMLGGPMLIDATGYLAK